jgi:cysteinyl-tRNA synthetase
MEPSLRLYNTLTRTKEAFRPLDPANVRLYACGPTVYDDAHIGNARPIIVFDLLFRLLRHLYGPDRVTYVRNITDVDDKINARAAERSISIRELTEGTARRFRDDIAALGVLPPTIEPRATEHIEEMKMLIERLVASGHAYVAEEHVLFDVPSMPDYGTLSKRLLDEMEAGARVDVAPYKRSPLDFVLWKPSKPGDPAWPSPAGIATPGRPGWHIECSAMAWKHLGETFDIHAGGIDLVFPHHENEVAQSRCCFGTKVMANYWLHNGFLQVEGEKMAKSAGNFVTIREIRENWNGVGWPGEAIRFAMLGTHYRQPIDWTSNALDEAHKILLEMSKEDDGEHTNHVPSFVVDALCDDLNSRKFMTELYKLHKNGDRDNVRAALRFLGFSADRSKLGRIVHARGEARARSFAQANAEVHHLKANDLVTSPPVLGNPELSVLPSGLVNKLVDARTAARVAKNWAESDRIRDELAAMGIVVKDNKDGTTTWELAR